MRAIPVRVRTKSNRLAAMNGWRGLGDTDPSQETSHSETSCAIIQSEPVVEVVEETYTSSDDVPTLAAEEQEVISTFAGESANKEGFFPSMDSVNEFITSIWSSLEEESKKSTINKISSNADNIASNAAVFIGDKLVSEKDISVQYQDSSLGLSIHSEISLASPLAELLTGSEGYFFATVLPTAVNFPVSDDLKVVKSLTNADGSVAPMLEISPEPPCVVTLTPDTINLIAQSFMLSLGACVLGYETDIFAADKNTLVASAELRAKMEQSIYSGALIINIIQKQSESDRKFLKDILNKYWSKLGEILIDFEALDEATAMLYDGTLDKGLSLASEEITTAAENRNTNLLFAVPQGVSVDYVIDHINAQLEDEFGSKISELLGRLDMYALDVELQLNEMGAMLAEFKNSAASLFSSLGLGSEGLASLDKIDQTGKVVEETLSTMKVDVQSSDAVTTGFSSLASVLGGENIFAVLEDANRVSFTPPLAAEADTPAGLSTSGEWLGPLPPPKDIFSVLAEAGVKEAGYLASVVDYTYAQKTGSSLAEDEAKSPESVETTLTSKAFFEKLKENVTAFASAVASVVGLQAKDVNSDTKQLDSAINAVVDQAKKSADGSAESQEKLAAIAALRDQALSVNQRSRDLASKLESTAKGNVIAVAKVGVQKEELSAMGVGSKLAIGALVGAALFFGAKAILKKKK